MKITISLSSDTVMSPGFYTLQELLDKLGVGDWTVQGQPMLEYGKTERIEVTHGPNARQLVIHRDLHGTYQAEIDSRDFSYCVVTRFHKVLQVCRSTDSISAKTLNALRYRDSKFDDWDNESSHGPAQILMFYKAKYKKGQTIKDHPWSTIYWYDCKNARYSGRD